MAKAPYVTSRFELSRLLFKALDELPSNVRNISIRTPDGKEMSTLIDREEARKLQHCLESFVEDVPGWRKKQCAECGGLGFFELEPHLSKRQANLKAMEIVKSGKPAWHRRPAAPRPEPPPVESSIEEPTHAAAPGVELIGVHRLMTPLPLDPHDQKFYRLVGLCATQGEADEFCGPWDTTTKVCISEGALAALRGSEPAEPTTAELVKALKADVDHLLDCIEVADTDLDTQSAELELRETLDQLLSRFR
ncbi:MAG: hypothetical protein ACF8MF_06675 [Phycisphaerales bacterium JB052]